MRKKNATLIDPAFPYFLGRSAFAQSAFHPDQQGFGFLLQQALRGEHMLDLAGTDAVGQRTECAMRAGMRTLHTAVIPGRVAPCSGPMTCTMPWRTSPILNSVIPKSAQLLSRVSTCKREIGSAIP